MDADAAGIEATLRALQEAESTGAVRAGSTSAHPDSLAEEEFSQKAQDWSRDALKRATVNFYVVPLSGKDPDEMIRADRPAWDAAVAGAKPFTDHVFETVTARKDLSQPGQRSELLQELLPVVRLIEEPVYRAHYVQRLARLALVNEDVVQSALRRSRPRTPRAGVEAPEPAFVSQAQREPGEEFCLALLLRHLELRPEGTALSPELFLLSQHRAIFAAWRETPDLESIRKALLDELHPSLERILQRDVQFLEGTRLRDALQDCVRRIERSRLSAAKQASSAALADPEEQEDMSAVAEKANAILEGSSSTDGDTRTLRKAIASVQDMEMGQRLHRTRLPAPPPASSPHGEDLS